MAKLKAPLMSLGASGQLGKALVFFPWKGIHAVRTHVVPTNPDTDAQKLQRGYMTAAVAAIHAAQALPTHELVQVDITAYATLAGTIKAAMTWFNMVCRGWMKQRVAALRSSIFHGGDITGGNTIITFNLYFTDDGANHITAGDFWYGTSPTALIHSVAATMFDAPYLAIGDLTGLTNGTKYYVQFRPTAHADFVGVRSGIYHATPTA